MKVVFKENSSGQLQFMVRDLNNALLDTTVDYRITDVETGTEVQQEDTVNSVEGIFIIPIIPAHTVIFDGENQKEERCLTMTLNQGTNSQHNSNFFFDVENVLFVGEDAT